LGLGRQFPSIGPECVKGIEINPYAAELARVTVWIGEIQWMRRNGFDVERKPILRPLETIECRDAVLNPDGSETVWPDAEFIVGNPPFLGGKLLRSGLGDHDVERLFDLYRGRVPPEADLVTYWFEKARAQVKSGQTKRVGLVATNSIRGGANRRVLDRIVSEHGIFEAWSDEPWVIDGANVRPEFAVYRHLWTQKPCIGGVYPLKRSTIHRHMNRRIFLDTMAISPYSRRHVPTNDATATQARSRRHLLPACRELLP
jgi:type II restriction/modification system DNA methylase subunit YeeA